MSFLLAEDLRNIRICLIWLDKKTGVFIIDRSYELLSIFLLKSGFYVEFDGIGKARVNYRFIEIESE